MIKIARFVGIFLFISSCLMASKYKKAIEKMESLRHGAKMTVIENPMYKKASRIEITPYYGFSSNDPYVDTSFKGGALIYHLSEFIGIEAAYFAANTTLTPLADQVHEEHPDKDEVSSVTQSFYNLNVGLTPIYSKLSVLSNFVMHYDVSFTAGLGQTKTNWGNNLTLNFGVGARIFAFKRVSLNVAFRDYIHKEKRQSLTISKHNLYTMFGLSIFIL
jgi:outer membrane beta-barrel protein